MMVAAWLVLTAMGLGAATSGARADGKVMPPVLVPQEVAMPDQRALLAWRDGVETLVIESAFVGKGTDFAWVVPLPSKPEVEPATRGTLASVAALMQPGVTPPAAELWWLALGLPLVGGVALLAGWRRVGWVFRACVVVSAGLLVGGVLAAVIGRPWGLVVLVLAVGIACWSGRDVVRREASLFSHLIALIVGLLFLAIMTPTVGKVRSSLGPVMEVGGVTVERGIVGDYDVALVSGEGEGVAGWLRENGYAIDAAAETVTREHAAAGGWFAASRVRREFTESGRSVPAPLMFRFAAAKPVYPMRLTGAGSKAALELELFVFGPERAVAEGLDSVSWGPLGVGDPSANVGRRTTGQPDDARVVTHPVLARLAEGAAVVTQLRGRLTPADMRADIFPRWEAGETTTQGLTAWSREAAAQATLAAGGGLALVVSVVLGFCYDGRRPPQKWGAPALAAALATSGAVWAAIPSVATREVGGEGAPRWFEMRYVPAMAAIALGDLDPAQTSDAQARAAFTAELKKMNEANGWKLEIGDGPGQVELAKTPEGRWRAIYYDAAGQARFSAGDDFELGWSIKEPTENGPRP